MKIYVKASDYTRGIELDIPITLLIKKMGVTEQKMNETIEMIKDELTKQ